MKARSIRRNKEVTKAKATAARAAKQFAKEVPLNTVPAMPPPTPLAHQLNSRAGVITDDLDAKLESAFQVYQDTVADARKEAADAFALLFGQ